METGDVLYVPRGLMHEALAEGDELSLHVTIGFHAVRWSEVLLEAIARAAVDDVELPGIPLGALVDGTPDGRSPRSSAATPPACSTASAGSACATGSRRVLLRPKERLGGLLLDAATGSPSTPAGPPRRRAARARAPGRRGGVDGAGPRHPVARARRHHARNALAGDRFTARSLGDDLDEKGRLTLARRLLAEGAVRHREGEP